MEDCGVFVAAFALVLGVVVLPLLEHAEMKMSVEIIAPIFTIFFSILILSDSKVYMTDQNASALPERMTKRLEVSGVDQNECVNDISLS